MLTSCSVREMPPGEEEDRERRGHTLCHDLSGLRKLFGSPENLSVEVSRGGCHLKNACCECIDGVGDQPANRHLQQSQSNRNENQQNRPGSQGGYGAQGGATGPSNAGSSFQAGELGGQGAEGADANYMYGQTGAGTGDGF